MNFRFVISDGAKAWQAEKDQKDCPVLGRRIGDKFPADFLGLEGYELLITGGSDNDGCPMRRDIDGIGRRRIMLTKGVGFNARKKGLRRRKAVRGNTISPDTCQINCMVAKKGAKPLEDVFGKREGKEKPEQDVKASQR